METVTQDGRLLTISTPLGKDVLLMRRMSATESLSKLFKLHVELVQIETKTGYKPTTAELSKLLGQSVTVSISQEDGGGRIFNGIINEFSYGNRSVRYSHYYATIVPSVWTLTQCFQSRIFQHKSVIDILKEVFKGFEVSYDVSRNYEPRNYCVQYRESDFDFASRLMEEEGIYYYFEHSDGNHKMILGDTSQSHRECPNKSLIPFLTLPGENENISAIVTWRTEYKLQTGKVTFWDHNFQLPTQNLDTAQPSQFNIGKNRSFELYDFPGEYSKKYDGIDKSGGESASDLQKIYQDKDKTSKDRMEALDGQYKIAHVVSDCSSLTAGHRFETKTHPNTDLNGQYVLVSVSHEAEQSPPYFSDEEVSRAYENGFTCIPYGQDSSTNQANPVFRPLPVTPKPKIYGSQTAIVVGPAGEEIFTDKYGRVKVQFYWDRYGKDDADSACWVRVAQAWAGSKWGAMFIPRIGMEVVVHFLEGDPDQPIITGCVYNADSMPPYTLPDEKTKSTIKTNSSKGGGGFNELRFEDKKGSEQIFIHGEKDLDINIKNDSKEAVGNDRHLVVTGSQYEQIKGDNHLHINGDNKEKVDGSISRQAASNIQEKAGQKYAMDSGMEVHIKAGMTVVIEAGMQLSLKAGGSFVDIGPAGVTISGAPLVLINSGGAAASGSGSSPDSPTDPKDADKADSGDVVKKATTPPPTTPATFSQEAQALKNAAASAAAFVNSAAAAGAGAAAGAKAAAAKAAKAAKAVADKAASEAKKAAASAAATAAALEHKAEETIKDNLNKAKEAIKQQEEAIKKKAQELQAIAKEKEQQMMKQVDAAKNLANEEKEKAAKAVQELKEKEQKAEKEIEEAKKQLEEQKKNIEEKEQQAMKQLNDTKEMINQQKEKVNQAKDSLKSLF